MPNQLDHVIAFVGCDEILDPHLGKLGGRPPDDLAIAVVYKLEAACRIELGKANNGLAEHGPQIKRPPL
jgi:hypothetical protein